MLCVSGQHYLDKDKKLSLQSHRTEANTENKWHKESICQQENKQNSAGANNNTFSRNGLEVMISQPSTKQSLSVRDRDRR